MKVTIIKTIRFIKGLTLILKPHAWLGWMRGPMLISSNMLSLSKWVAAQDKKSILNDFYTAKRDYSKRYTLYAYITEQLKLENEAVDFLEFGVGIGKSFEWWSKHNINPESRFYGFDTFEGLPENWGTFSRGAMAADIPVLNDERTQFVKGLFQDSVPGFLLNSELRNGKRKILHLDADLFSSTLFALTSLAPYLKKGDILMFDEFNVPNHEFYAFKLFCDTYYVKTKLIAAVNNYYQVAMIIE